MTKLRVVAAGLIASGIVVLALAGLLPRLLPTEYFWTPTQAEEQSAAASRLHQVTHETAQLLESNKASAADKIHAQQQLDAAQARFDSSRESLEQAQFWRERVPQVGRWIGTGIAVVGILLLAASKES